MITDSQCCGSGFYESGSGSSISSEPGSGSGSRVFMTKKWKNTVEEKNLHFFIKNCNSWVFPTFGGHFCPPGSGTGSIALPLLLLYPIGSWRNSQRTWQIPARVQMSKVCKSGLKLNPLRDNIVVKIYVSLALYNYSWETVSWIRIRIQEGKRTH